MEGALAPFHLPSLLGACQASLGDRHKARYVTALRISSKDRVDE